MKIHIDFTANGRHYGWSKFRSVLDFFFPVVKWHPVKKGDKFKYAIIRKEAAVAANTLEGVVSRDFYTFRAFAMFCLTMPLFYLKENARKFAESIGVEPKLALKLGAIALDTSNALQATTATSLTYAFTCTGSNLTINTRVTGTNAAADRITGITYNTVAYTQINVSTRPGGSDRWRSYWNLINPATGANNVVVSSSPSDYIESSSVSYTGVNQSTSIEASNVATTVAGTSLNCAVTPLTANAWVVGFGSADVSPNFAAGTNTQLVAGSQNFMVESTLNPIASPASTTLQITNSATDMVLFAAAVKPFTAAAASTPHRFSFLGVGS